ncbi:hypothetical protein [Noviherbaspirillum massiliense]|uniref:hypothetical protein n=1 Tax=Noviherbaspirillum massiliense TaxID=1465823 RepID=UPI0003024BC3|nr:hypothetical protein [Noviherbaspirillum massiliense]
MPDKKSPAPEVKHLLSILSDHGSRHLTEAEIDLAQTNLLLCEAIEKLAASFLALNEATEAQQAAVEQLLAGSASPEEIRQVLKDKQSEIGRHVRAAVTGLQFQDMTNQLIDRTARRVAGLRALLGAVGTGSAAIQSACNTQTLTAALSAINLTLEERSAGLDSTLRKAVAQTHLESGEIELF